MWYMWYTCGTCVTCARGICVICGTEEYKYRFTKCVCLQTFDFKLNLNARAFSMNFFEMAKVISYNFKIKNH